MEFPCVGGISVHHVNENKQSLISDDDNTSISIHTPTKQRMFENMRTVKITAKNNRNATKRKIIFQALS